MTQKDYELIASAIDDTFMRHEDWRRTVGQVANAMADRLQAENNKFNRTKFLEICGVSE